jgi:hypothetical protein
MPQITPHPLDTPAQNAHTLFVGKLSYRRSKEFIIASWANLDYGGDGRDVAPLDRLADGMGRILSASWGGPDYVPEAIIIGCLQAMGEPVAGEPEEPK